MAGETWEPNTVPKIVGGFNIPKSVIETKVDTLTFLELLLTKNICTEQEIDLIRAAVVEHLNELYPELKLTYATPLPLAEQAPLPSQEPKKPDAPLFIDAPPPKFL